MHGLARADAAVRRGAIVVSSCVFLLVALALPGGPDGADLLSGSAFAAGDGNDTGASALTGPAPDGAVDDAAASVMAESGDDSVEPILTPTTGRVGAAPKVIKEVAGVGGETELSAEEELEAIRNGWGTWRTADGPGSVVAQ